MRGSGAARSTGGALAQPVSSARKITKTFLQRSIGRRARVWQVSGQAWQLRFRQVLRVATSNGAGDSPNEQIANITADPHRACSSCVTPAHRFFKEIDR